MNIRFPFLCLILSVKALSALTLISVLFEYILPPRYHLSGNTSMHENPAKKGTNSRADRIIKNFCISLLISALILPAGCTSETTKTDSTYYPYHTLLTVDSLQNHYYELLAELHMPNVHIWQSMEVSPNFVLGEDSGLDPTLSADFSFAEQVSLPHRVYHPYTALWYRFSVEIDSAIVLLINADDGAQLYLNGIRQREVAPDCYLLEPGDNETEITVRVLNQAMAGGLRGLYLCGEKDFSTERTIRKQQYATLILLRKYLLFKNRHELPNAEGEKLIQAGEIQNIRLKRFLQEYPLLTAGPVVIPVSEDSLEIRWKLSDSDTALFEFGEDPTALSNSLQVIKSPYGLHTMRLSGSEDMLYYRISSRAMQTEIIPINPFKRNDSITLALFGDSQGGWETFSSLSRQMAVQQPDLILGVGDLVSHGADSLQWFDFMNAFSPAGKSVPSLLLAGNHDYDGYANSLVAHNYQQYLATEEIVPYFYYKLGGIAMIGIDPNTEFPLGISSDSEQYTWLLKTLGAESWQSAHWRILMVHQPPYSQGWPGYEGAPMIRALIDSLAPKHKIDLLLSGHTHDYERKLIDYKAHTMLAVICGAAGGHLEPRESNPVPQMDTLIKSHLFALLQFSGNELLLKALDSEGELLDKIEYKKSDGHLKEKL